MIYIYDIIYIYIYIYVNIYIYIYIDCPRDMWIPMFPRTKTLSMPQASSLGEQRNVFGLGFLSGGSLGGAGSLLSGTVDRF